MALYKKDNVLYIDYWNILSITKHYYIYLYKRKENNKKTKNCLLNIIKGKINVFITTKMTYLVKKIEIINAIKIFFKEVFKYK